MEAMGRSWGSSGRGSPASDRTAGRNTIVASRSGRHMPPRSQDASPVQARLAFPSSRTISTPSTRRYLNPWPNASPRLAHRALPTCPPHHVQLPYLRRRSTISLLYTGCLLTHHAMGTAAANACRAQCAMDGREGDIRQVYRRGPRASISRSRLTSCDSELLPAHANHTLYITRSHTKLYSLCININILYSSAGGAVPKTGRKRIEARRSTSARPHGDAPLSGVYSRRRWLDDAIPSFFPTPTLSSPDTPQGPGKIPLPCAMRPQH